MLVDLKDKNILLGVTGSIAAYKSLELLRLFIKSGANVKVVMSESAKRFVGKLSFEALSENVVVDEDSESWANSNNHIELGRWADVFVIAPVTANTINKLSNGISDNILTQSAIACDKPKILAPAANVRMMKNPITEASIKMLKICGYTIVSSQTKLLACKEEADGAMAEPIEIYYNVARELLKEEFWDKRRVVVSAGGTVEKIDDVRFISNFSSGKMGSSLALSLYLKGSDVCLVSSSFPFTLPLGIYTLEAKSSQDMKSYLIDSIRVSKKGLLTQVSLSDNETKPKLIQKKPYLFMSAAVSDFVPSYPQNGKIKKESIGNEWSLQMKKNEDILDSLDKSDIVSIGFKAEMDEQNALMNAKKMLEKKSIDGVCLNLLKDSSSFGSDENSITFISKGKEISFTGSKLEVSFEILKEAKALC